MSRYFPSSDRDHWSPIDLHGNLPLLGLVSSEKHPGSYQCRWKYKTVNGNIVPMQLIVKRFDQTSRYPHLTIDFDPNSGAIVKFHASEFDNNGQKISYGSEEIIELVLLLRPLLLKDMRDMSTDNILNIFDRK